jgi:hypothetical protein
MDLDKESIAHWETGPRGEGYKRRSRKSFLGSLELGLSPLAQNGSSDRLEDRLVLEEPEYLMGDLN